MSEPKRLLIVAPQLRPDEAFRQWSLAQDVQWRHVSDLRSAMSVLAEAPGQLLWLDVGQDVACVQSLARELHQHCPGQVCVVSADASAIASIRELLNAGSVQRLLLHPFTPSELTLALDQAFSYLACHLGDSEGAQRMQGLTFSWQARFAEKNRELALLTQRLQWSHLLFDALPEVVLGLSVQGQIIEANQCARRVFEGESLVGENIASLVPPEVLVVIQESMLHEGASRAFFALRVQGQKYSFRCIPLRFSGELAGCLLYGAPAS